MPQVRFATAIITLVLFASTTFAEIEEIVVTAQKRSESIQEIPISITALTGEDLEKRGLNDMQALARTVPNFDMPSSNSLRNVRIRIRGIGSTGSNAGIETSVGTFLDGLYMPVGGMTFGDLNDIQTVEVLRGPQGTLYGRNTPIGALNITTRKPTQGFESLLRLSYGDYDEKVVNGYVGGALSDDVAGRLSFWYRDREGYEENLFTGDDINGNSEWGVRAKIQFAPSDEVEVTTTFYYSEVDRECCMSEQISPNDPDWGIATPGFLAAQAAAGYPFGNFYDDDHKVDGDGLAEDTNESLGGSVQADWNLTNDMLFTSITGYQEWENNDSAPVDSLTNLAVFPYAVQTEEILSQEFRITSPAGQALDYLAGIYLYAQDSKNVSNTFFAEGANRVFPVPPSVCPSPCTMQAGDLAATRFEQETRSVAAYGNLTWHISEIWDVTPGLRYTRDKKDVDLAHTNGAGNGFVANRLVFPESIPGKLDRSESKVTWSVNTRYHLSDDVMLFATSSTGFKSGGFNARRLPPGRVLEFEDENSFTYEAGIKSFLNDRKVMLNLTLFHTELEDFQEVTLAPNGVGFIVGNAGEQEVQGVEADFTWMPNDNLAINGSFAYLDSEYTDYFNALCPAGQAPTSPNGTCDLTGERPLATPEVEYSLGIEWAQPMVDGNMEWFARADYSWRDDQILTYVAGSDIGDQEAYGLLDLRLGIASTDGRWTVEAFAKNVSDEVYMTFKANVPAGGLISGGGVSGVRGFAGWYGPPRVWGLQLTLRTGN